MTGTVITIYSCAFLAARIFEAAVPTSVAKILAIVFLVFVACLFAFLLICLWPVAKTQSMKDREEKEKQDYPLPRTLAEALRKGYEWDFGVANSNGPGHIRETGVADFVLMGPRTAREGGQQIERECLDIIQVPYTATFKYGRPRKENSKQ